MSVKTNQSIVNQLVPTLSSDSIDGSGCTLLLDLPKDVYWKIVEVSAKDRSIQMRRQPNGLLKNSETYTG